MDTQDYDAYAYAYVDVDVKILIAGSALSRKDPVSPAGKDQNSPRPDVRIWNRSPRVKDLGSPAGKVPGSLEGKDLSSPAGKVPGSPDPDLRIWNGSPNVPLNTDPANPNKGARGGDSNTPVSKAPSTSCTYTIFQYLMVLLSLIHRIIMTVPLIYIIGYGISQLFNTLYSVEKALRGVPFIAEYLSDSPLWGTDEATFIIWLITVIQVIQSILAKASSHKDPNLRKIINKQLLGPMIILQFISSLNSNNVLTLPEDCLNDTCYSLITYYINKLQWNDAQVNKLLIPHKGIIHDEQTYIVKGDGDLYSVKKGCGIQSIGDIEQAATIYTIKAGSKINEKTRYIMPL